MIFWKTKQLRNDLINETVTEKDKMKYLLATMVMYALSGQTGGSEAVDGYLLAESLAVVFVTIIGILICYDTNKNGDGKNFIERFICISWPVTIRLSVFLVVGFLGLLILFIGAGGEELATDSDVGSLGVYCLIFFETVYFWRIKKHLEYIAKGQLA